MMQRVAIRQQIARQFGKQRGRVGKGLHVDDLRTDMHIDAADGQPLQVSPLPHRRRGRARSGCRTCCRISRSRFSRGFGIHIRVDADGNAGAGVFRQRHFGERAHLRFGFHIESRECWRRAPRPFPRASCRRRKRRFCHTGTPAASARRNSPRDTMSMPAPSRASVAMTA